LPRLDVAKASIILGFNDKQIHFSLRQGVIEDVLSDVVALTSSKLAGVQPLDQRIYERLRRRVVRKPGPLTVKSRLTSPILAHGACGAGADAEPAARRRHRTAQTQRQSLHRRGQELLQGSAGADHQGTGAFPNHTDGWLGYDGLLLSGYKHRRIHHHANEFARAKNNVIGIESFWSYAKFRFIKLRDVRPEFFFLHLKESEWRGSRWRPKLNRISRGTRIASASARYDFTMSIGQGAFSIRAAAL